MTEEIKEILEYLKNDNYETEAPTDIEVSNYDLFKVINSVDNDKLLNYITNLQKENEELNRMCELYSKSLYNADLTRYKNIIKEIREYIKEWQSFPHTNGSTHNELKNLLEILDKEKK